MKQLKKPISIICQRIQNEIIIWISFLICLVVIFAYHAVSKECLLSQFSSILNFISEYQTEIISLAISYIAGVIFYVFSVLIPYALIEVNRKEVALYHKLAKRIYISEVSQ